MVSPIVTDILKKALDDLKQDIWVCLRTWQPKLPEKLGGNHYHPSFWEEIKPHMMAGRYAVQMTQDNCVEIGLVLRTQQIGLLLAQELVDIQRFMAKPYGD